MVLFMLLVSHKSIVPYLSQKYIKDYGITYSSISGSLVSGITIKNINYEDAIKIKSLTLKYNPLLLIRPNPKISFIEIDELRANINHFNTQKNSESELDLIGFQVSKLVLHNAIIQYKNKSIKFDALGKGIAFDNSLHVEALELQNTNIKDSQREINLVLKSENIEYTDSLQLSKIALNIDLEDNTYGTFKTDFNGTKISYYNDLANIEDFTIFLQSPYGHLNANAKLKNNTITAKANVTPEETLLKEYLDFAIGLPKTYGVDLNANTKKINISTILNPISLKDEQNLTAQNSLLQVSYLIEQNTFDFSADYNLSYQDYALHIKQLGTVDANLNYHSKLKAQIIKTPIKLPIDGFNIALDGNDSFMNADINSSFFYIQTKTKDFKKFLINTNIKDMPLDFIAEDFKNDILYSKSSSVLHLSPFNFKSKIKAEDNHLKYDGDIEIDFNSLLLKGDIQPKFESKLFENFDSNLISNMSFVYFNDSSKNMLNIDSKRTNITIFEKNRLLKGWGNLDKNSFKVSGDIEKNGKSDIKLSASFPSITKLLKELKIEVKNKNITYDAEVNLEAQISYDGQIELTSFIKVPWYYVLLDEDTSYSGQDLFFKVKKKQNNIIIDNYSVNFLEHKIDSKKPSIISLDKNQTIQIKELWIYDNLLIEGNISTTEKNINLKIKSDAFHYDGDEGNITAKADITIQIDEDEQNIEGYITLLDGLVKYIPKKNYSITDNDIIIIQEIDNEVINNRFINLHIDTKKPIKYKIENVELDISPDFSIFKDRGENMKILGMATINKGEVKVINKSFIFDKSEVYFYEDNNNPLLNLNIKHQTLNYIDIGIFVTGKLESPVIIFSSKPTMSQNDIMSYVLFGEPASDVSNNFSQNGNNKVYLGSILLGTQLKQILNQSDTFKIDTLNILTNEEGSLGYEIGSRINKDLRVIYKNNIVSSVVVQYSVNRSIRVDVDANQESQGVSIIYTKDF